MTEEDEIFEEQKPLSPDEFRDALNTLSSLGLSWTADRVPRVIAKTPEAESAFLSDEYQVLVDKYPYLPRELSAVVYHALTGAMPFENIVGPPEDLREKVAIVRSLLITDTYRSEFFFRYALKVPYLETVDWEVVLKTRERNVVGQPNVGYALLMLIFHNTNAKTNVHENYTVAVNLSLVNKLIETLSEMKTALEDVNEITSRLTDTQQVEEKTDGREN